MTRWIDSPVTLDTPEKGICRDSSSTNASNSSENPESLPAHGGLTCTTLPCGSFTRGTRTSRSHWYWKKFRCR